MRPARSNTAPSISQISKSPSMRIEPFVRIVTFVAAKGSSEMKDSKLQELPGNAGFYLKRPDQDHNQNSDKHKGDAAVQHHAFFALERDLAGMESFRTDKSNDVQCDQDDH